MAISHIGINTGIRNTSGGDVTFSAHASTQIDDLMIGVFCHDAITGVTAISGWTVLAVETVFGDNNWQVCYRIFQSGDTTWTWDEGDSLNSVWGVSTYRGVNTTTPFIAEGFTEDTVAGTTVTTPTKTNTDASAWYVLCYGEMGTNDSTKSWTSDVGTERFDLDTTASTDNSSVALYDSNGVIATGDYAGTGTETVSSAGTMWAWIGILKPIATDVSKKLMLLGCGS